MKKESSALPPPTVMKVYYIYQVNGKRIMEAYIELKHENVDILALKKAIAADLETVIWHHLTVLAHDGTELRNSQYFDPSAHGGEISRMLTVKLEGVFACVLFSVRELCLSKPTANVSAVPVRAQQKVCFSRALVCFILFEGEPEQDRFLQNLRAVSLAHEVTPQELAFTFMISSVVLPNVLGNAPTTQSLRNRDFKRKLCKKYDCSRKINGYDWVRCMVLDMYFPPKLVTAAHLFRCSHEYLASTVVQIDDIDDVRNGMLLFKPLEAAFDHLQISFLSENAGSSFELKLFDETIREKRLIDCLSEYQKTLLQRAVDEWNCDFDVDTTFGQVDGTPIAFKNVDRPYNRCLKVQARIANFTAVKEGRTSASFQFDDFWSENMSLGDKMELLRRSINTQHDRTEERWVTVVESNSNID
jgi:HNH endonuclease